MILLIRQGKQEKPRRTWKTEVIATGEYERRLNFRDWIIKRRVIQLSGISREILFKIKEK